MNINKKNKFKVKKAIIFYIIFLLTTGCMSTGKSSIDGDGEPGVVIDIEHEFRGKEHLHTTKIDGGWWTSSKSSYYSFSFGRKKQQHTVQEDDSCWKRFWKWILY